MIVEISTLYLLATLVVFTAASPGPDVLYIASNALSGRWKAGLCAWMGIFSGVLMYVCATALGLGVLFSAVPVLYTVVKWLGVAYLLYIAYGFLKSAMTNKNDFEVQAAEDKTLRQIYFKGLMVTLLNPKSILFFTAFLPQFVDVDKGHLATQLFLLGLAATCVGQMVYGCYTAFFFVLGRKLKGRPEFRQGSKFVRALDGFCGVLYGVFAFGLAVWKRA